MMHSKGEDDVSTALGCAAALQAMLASATHVDCWQGYAQLTVKHVDASGSSFVLDDMSQSR